MNAAMVYLILVTARLTPDIWDPYDVLGVSRVCSRSCEESACWLLTVTERRREGNQEALPKTIPDDASR
jgi:hypothetical protein